jgi:hypothetical protein
VIRRFVALVTLATVAVPVGAVMAQEQPTPPARQPLVDVPVGCPVQPLPDVVFVGTAVDSDYRTVRYRIDQARAGDIGQFSSQGYVDVRYGIDAKYLDEGDQYLIGASYDGQIQSLRSRVQPATPTFGGNEIIEATESDRECPEVVDPMRTLHTDGTSVPVLRQPRRSLAFAGRGAGARLPGRVRPRRRALVPHRFRS